VILVSACTIGGSGEPTQDINTIRTEAVQTAMVEMTVQAALSPSETPLPPTLTPLPTATLSSNAAQPAAGSSSSSSSSSGGGGTSATAGPTATPDPWKCELVDEYPYDIPQMTGWEYDRHFVLKNAGTSTWWGDVVYVKFDETCTVCENISYQKKFFINKNVVPGDKVDIAIDIDVPTRPKEFPGYTMAWDMYNDNGEIFCEFWNNVPSTYPAPTKTPMD